LFIEGAVSRRETCRRSIPGGMRTEGGGGRQGGREEVGGPGVTLILSSDGRDNTERRLCLLAAYHKQRLDGWACSVCRAGRGQQEMIARRKQDGGAIALSKQSSNHPWPVSRDISAPLECLRGERIFSPPG